MLVDLVCLIRTATLHISSLVAAHHFLALCNTAKILLQRSCDYAAFLMAKGLASVALTAETTSATATNANMIPPVFPNPDSVIASLSPPNAAIGSPITTPVAADTIIVWKNCLRFATPNDANLPGIERIPLPSGFH